MQVNGLHPGKKREHGARAARWALKNIYGTKGIRPVALRYAWGHSPMGNLKVQGHPDMPLPEFRTDTWDLPEREDLSVESITREVASAWEDDGKARLEFRRTEEAKRALEILERLKTLGQPIE